MPVTHAVLLVLAGLAAGTVNAVVGSGSLITFPTLLALGYPPVLANVSNNIGMVPGGLSGALGYRRELRGQGRRLRALGPASLLGGLTGSWLLLVLSGGVFRRVVVVLIVLALVLVVLQPRLARRLAARRAAAVAPAATGSGASAVAVLGVATTEPGPITAPLLAMVALVGVYGGYFGAAQGILLIALLGIFLGGDLQVLNGIKNVLAMTVNLMASAVFVASTAVDWRVVACIAVGSMVGGQVGSTVGRRLDPRALRALIVVVGVLALVRLVT